MAEQWVVYAKPCLEHTESVIGSLARYTHRIALSKAGILGLDDDPVSLSDRDDRDGGHKTLTVDAPELIRRFLLHLLPKGLMRVRHYRLLGHRCRVQRLAQLRKLLAVLAAPPPEPRSEAEQGREPEPGWPCPVCRRRRMRLARTHWAVRLIADAAPTPRSLSLPTE